MYECYTGCIIDLKAVIIYYLKKKTITRHFVSIYLYQVINLKHEKT